MCAQARPLFGTFDGVLRQDLLAGELRACRTQAYGTNVSARSTTLLFFGSEMLLTVFVLSSANE